MYNLKRIWLILLLSFLLTACSRVNQTNFDRIQPGMSIKQVMQILGEPNASDSINIAGISGTSATWQNKNTEINIQFLNDKVQIKNFNKIDK